MSKSHFDYIDVQSQVFRAGIYITSKFNDGFAQWPVKQDLYRIKFLIEDIINDSEKFEGEEQWIDQMHKQKMWNRLKK